MAMSEQEVEGSLATMCVPCPPCLLPPSPRKISKAKEIWDITAVT